MTHAPDPTHLDPNRVGIGRLSVEQLPGGDSPATEITPNVVITDPVKRRKLGVILYLLLILTGAASLVLAFFPELNFGNDIVGRAILLSTTLVTWLASAFGLAVTTPNVPR